MPWTGRAPLLLLLLPGLLLLLRGQGQGLPDYASEVDELGEHIDYKDPCKAGEKGETWGRRRQSKRG